MISSVFEYILSSKVQSVYITIYYIFEVHKLFSNKVLPFGIWCIKKKNFLYKNFFEYSINIILCRKHSANIFSVESKVCYPNTNLC